MTQETLEAALMRAQRSHERIGEALVAMRAVSRRRAAERSPAQVGLPFLSREEIPSALPVMKNLSAKYLRQYVACPVTVEGDVVTVATADPTNPVLLDDLRQTGRERASLRGAAGGDPRGDRAHLRRGRDDGAPEDRRGHRRHEGEGDGEEDVKHLRDMAFEAPVVRLANLLIEDAMTAEASDIHIEPFEDALRIRYRIDGILYDQESPPRRLQAALTSRMKIMAEMDIAERRLPQDGRIRVTLHGRRVDIRVSTVPTVTASRS